ncbi:MULTISPECIES: GGDEF domain-containing protein [Halomonadaceae]|nr:MULTISPECIES: GGDEF domain-containing protein [Halomonas]
MSDVIEALGLEAADELLFEMSQKLSRAISGNHQAYRITPDELALIVPDLEPHDLDTISQQLLEAGEETPSIQQMPVRIQLALGSAITDINNKIMPVKLLREPHVAI